MDGRGIRNERCGFAMFIIVYHKLILICYFMMLMRYHKIIIPELYRLVALLRFNSFDCVYGVHSLTYANAPYTSGSLQSPFGDSEFLVCSKILTSCFFACGCGCCFFACGCGCCFFACERLRYVAHISSAAGAPVSSR